MFLQPPTEGGHPRLFTFDRFALAIQGLSQDTSTIGRVPARGLTPRVLWVAIPAFRDPVRAGDPDW